MPKTRTTSVDTIRGSVIETGSEPATALLLVPSRGGEQLSLSGPALPLLRRVVGLDVMIRGNLTDQRAPVTPSGARVFSAMEFAVRAVEGVEALDGIVTFDGGRYSLRTADGVTHFTAYLPEALRIKRGARVFLAGRLDRAPEAYGVIAEAR